MSLLSLIIKKAGFLSLLFFVLTVPDAVVSQNIFDVKVLEKDQGVQEPIVNHVVRDKYGFFYIFSHNYIQRYDGQNFETCDISLLLKDKINLSTISSITLLENGKISFQINEFLNKLYYIESGSLIVKSISIAKAAKAISNDKTQYLVHRSKTGLFQALSSPLTTDVIPKLLFTIEIEPIDIIKLEDNYYFTSPSNNVFLIKWIVTVYLLS